MYTHLVVPLDGSAFAEHALAYAALIAKQAGAALDLVLVRTSYAVASLDATIQDTVDRWQAEQRERETNYLHDAAARVQEATGVSARPVLLTGAVSSALDGHVQESGADLVVMTTHGRSGLRRAWLGSVAEALLRHAHVPVLLVRPSDDEPVLGEPRALFGHVMVVLDGTRANEHALHTALALVSPETRISLVRAVSPPRAPTSSFIPHAALLNQQLREEREREAATYLEQQAELLRAHGRPVETHVIVSYHASQALLAWAAEHAVDAIALSSHGHMSGLRLLLGSVAQDVVRAGSVPVLVG